MQEKNKKVVVPLTHSLSVWASARAIKFALGNDLYTGWTLTRFTHQKARNGSALFSPVFTSATNWNRDGRINRRALHWTRRDSYFYLFLLRRRKRRRGIDYMTTPLQQTTTLHTVYVGSNNNINNINTREGMEEKRSIGRLLLLSLGFDACRRSKGSVETFEWMRK